MTTLAYSLCSTFVLVMRLLAIEVVLHAGYAVGATPDVLERPALISKRAVHAVLLAVAPAGKRLLAVGERGIVLYSDDDARTWRQALVPVSTTLTALHVATEKKAWSVGHAGVVLHTKDGGASWVKQLDGNQATRLMLQAAQQDVQAHDDEQARHRLREAQRMLREGADKPFFDVLFLDEKRGFIVGAYGLFFVTQDGGRTWLSWLSHIDNPRGKHLYAIKASGTVLYIAGEEGGLYRSTDAGQSFVEMKTPYPGSYFGVLPLEKNSVVVYGLRGNAYGSHDAGRHWHKIGTGTPATLTSGTVLRDGSVVLVSQAGEVLRSTDHGRSFQTLSVTHSFPFSSVTQTDDGDLVLVGVRGFTRLSMP